jgi:hypothetical protein
MKTKFAEHVRFQRSEFFVIKCQIAVIVEFREWFFRTLFLILIEAILKSWLSFFTSFITAAVSDVSQSMSCGHWSWLVDNKNDFVNIHIDSVPQLRFQTTNWRLKSATVTRLFPEYGIMQLIGIYRFSIFIASVIRGMDSGSIRGHRSTRGVIPPRDWRELLGCLSWRECSVFRMPFLLSLPILK